MYCIVNTVTGKVAEAKYAIAGSGGLKAPNLDVQVLRESVAGSGDVAARSGGTADIDILGSGDVTVSGRAKCKINKMASGNAHCS